MFSVLYFVLANEGPKQGLSRRWKSMKRSDLVNLNLPEERVPVSVTGRPGSRWVRRRDLFAIEKGLPRRVRVFASPHQREHVERAPAKFIRVKK